MIGTKVEHYRIVEKIGEGGMGEVFVAEDETLQRRVALKAIRRSRRLDESTRQRFVREARMLSALDHPGVCTIYDYLETGDGDFLVLELVEGRTLADVLGRGKVIPRSQALDIVQQLAEVLRIAHEAGVVHRDLKPGNVMLTPDGLVKVLDFGLSRRDPLLEKSGADSEELVREKAPEEGDGSSQVSDDESTLVTRPGTVMGTLQYMSPEQARAEGVTTATDIFSLGLILQELLTRDMAHPLHLRASELVDRVSEGEVRISPKLSREMASLVRELTHPRAAARPNAGRVVERLRLLRGRKKRLIQRAAVAGLLLTGALAWLKYTIDLRRRERQAEDLVEYLIVDLRKELEPIGRLDILADVGHKALEYFQHVPASDWTDEELTHRCKAFYQLGAVLSQQGDQEGAMGFFLPALDLAEELVRRDPTNRDWIFERGQLEFYVGMVPFYGEDYEAARPYFEAYNTTSRELAALEPDNETYRLEEIYALANLGALELGNGQMEQARETFDGVVAKCRALVEEKPGNADFELELADALSWCSRATTDTDLDRTLTHLREELEIRERLRVSDPRNSYWEYLYSTCLWHFAVALIKVGDLEGAESKLSDAAASARDLCEADSSNTDWRQLLGVTLTEIAGVFRERGLLEKAEGAALEAMDILSELRTIDSSHEAWRDQRRRAQAVYTHVQQERGRHDSALTSLKGLLDTARPGDPTSSVGNLWFRQGNSLAALGRVEDARSSWERALVTLERSDGSDGVKKDVLRAWTLIALERQAEAASLLAELESAGARPEALRANLEDAGAVAKR